MYFLRVHKGGLVTPFNESHNSPICALTPMTVVLGVAATACPRPSAVGLEVQPRSSGAPCEMTRQRLAVAGPVPPLVAICVIRPDVGTSLVVTLTRVGGG